MQMYMALFLLFGLLSLPASGTELESSADVDFSGTLVAEPCVVAPGEQGDNMLPGYKFCLSVPCPDYP